jgi:DNA-binding NarL/FixJ family response regulator
LASFDLILPTESSENRDRARSRPLGRRALHGEIALVGPPSLFWEGLQAILAGEAGMTVVGSAESGPAALELAAEARPDVILVDLELPGGALGLIRDLRVASPWSSVIAFGSMEDNRVIAGLLELRISAFLLKSITRRELLLALSNTLAGGERVTLSISRESLTRMQSGETGPLSPRELDVLALAAEALSNAQIAGRLSITQGTVKRHLRNVFGKLDAVSRIDAVNKAIAAGLIERPRAQADAPGEPGRRPARPPGRPAVQ